MSFIFTIIGLMISLDIIWWIVLARLTNHAIGRVVLSLFMLAMMAGLIAIIAARMSRTGENGRQAADALLTAARSQFRVGVGPRLFP